MKAAFIKQFGGPEVLKYGDLPNRVAGPGEVVIDVVAASVNGADWKMRRRLALIGLTAMIAIEDMLKLPPGEDPDPRRSGRGRSFAIQLAKHIGAHVITTASAANQAYLRDIGADEIIDYNASDFTQVVAN